MARRFVVSTDDLLQNGKPIPRAYIAQVDDQFAQFYANLIGMLDNIVNNPEMTGAVRIAAAKEMRFMIVEQRKILEEIERRQDTHEMENRSVNLRSMISNDPHAAIIYIENEISKLLDFKEFIIKVAASDRYSIPLLSMKDGEEPF